MMTNCADLNCSDRLNGLVISCNLMFAETAKALICLLLATTRLEYSFWTQSLTFRPKNCSRLSQPKTNWKCCVGEMCPQITTASAKWPKATNHSWDKCLLCPTSRSMRTSSREKWVSFDSDFDYHFSRYIFWFNDKSNYVTISPFVRSHRFYCHSIAQTFKSCQTLIVKWVTFVDNWVVVRQLLHY